VRLVVTQLAARFVDCLVMAGLHDETVRSMYAPHERGTSSQRGNVYDIGRHTFQVPAHWEGEGSCSRVPSQLELKSLFKEATTTRTDRTAAGRNIAAGTFAINDVDRCGTGMHAFLIALGKLDEADEERDDLRAIEAQMGVARIANAARSGKKARKLPKGDEEMADAVQHLRQARKWFQSDADNQPAVGNKGKKKKKKGKAAGVKPNTKDNKPKKKRSAGRARSTGPRDMPDATTDLTRALVSRGKYNSWLLFTALHTADERVQKELAVSLLVKAILSYGAMSATHAPPCRAQRFGGGRPRPTRGWVGAGAVHRAEGAAVQAGADA